MPDPYAEQDVPQALSRRRLLKLSAACAAACLAPPRRLFAQTSESPVLVMLELAGGNDGLNTVVPAGDALYPALRGPLALDLDSVLPLEPGFGLHPSLSGLARRFKNGRLALIQGVGYPEPQRSHFLSRDIWHTADGAGRGRDTGWIGRLADHAFRERNDPNMVVALGTQAPYSCRGEHSQAVTLSSPAAYRLLGRDEEIATLDTAVAAQDTSERARAFLRKAYLDARASSDAVREAAARHEPAVTYPDSDLAHDLRLVAGLITGGLGTQVFTLSTGGFDTHTKQLLRQERLLRDLDQALDAFLRDLDAHDAGRRVLVVVSSEFGRRVRPNASAGTDHGTAGPVFVLGASVQGGLYGAAPSLADLDDNGDLRFTTDFRRVYASVVQDWFDTDPGPILGAGYQSLPLLG